MQEEILDLVDEKDQIIGQLERSLVHKKGINNFRVVNAFIVNSKGQLWIPRRTENKRLFPLHLDTAVGGHVSSGETYDQAFRREMLEEINLDIKNTNYEKLGYLNPREHNVSAFMCVYKIFYDKVPPYNKNDFLEFYWFYPDELLELLKLKKDKSKTDVPLLIKYFF